LYNPQLTCKLEVRCEICVYEALSY
jgi:hypothetical protein